MKKRGKDVEKLREVVRRLAAGEGLEPKHRPHPLTGKWRPLWECHIEPDWLLVYQIEEEFLLLVNTGTHADLF